jgi:hypothetical protein
MTEFDVVQKAKHYNSHPSGVEVIEWLDVMQYPCLFTAAKYLTRYEHKGKPVEDLEKALYYLERHIWNINHLWGYGSDHLWMVIDNDDVREKFQKYLSKEPNKLVRESLVKMVESISSHRSQDAKNRLRAVHRRIEKLIEIQKGNLS